MPLTGPATQARAAAPAAADQNVDVGRLLHIATIVMAHLIRVLLLIGFSF
jgi:hypothetical protein